ncbi:MAG: DNRLRE domain-containing protein [Kofleriaceae bacterium]
MSSRTSNRAAAAAACAIGAMFAGCGDDPDPAAPALIHVCGRGDRAELAAAIGSGTLDLDFLDSNGTTVAMATVAADASDSELPTDIPASAVSVRVSGRATAGGPVLATGTGATAGDGAGCVCFSLIGEHLAACEGVTCTVDNGACAFDPPGPRTLVFGENDTGTMLDDVHGVTADTYLRSTTGMEMQNFGQFTEVRADSDPAMVGLLRFDLRALPKTAKISSATLTLTLSTDPEATTDYPIGFSRVLEAWDEGTNATPDGEGCASWMCRKPGVPWTSVGCGPGSCAASVEASLPNATQLGMAYSVSLLAAVSDWVSDPASNFGIAINVDGGTNPMTNVVFVSSQAPAADGARPRLSVTYELPD